MSWFLMILQFMKNMELEFTKGYGNGQNKFSDKPENGKDQP